MALPLGPAGKFDALVFFAYLTCFASLAKQDRTSIVEFKNGKINFKQKPMSFEKQSETLQGTVDAPFYIRIDDDDMV